mgnify:CR=1 FL=1
MKHSFKLSVKAKVDLTKIAVFTEQRWGRTQRNNYLFQLDQSFHQLADNPDIEVSCDYIMQGYRQFPLASHIVFYKVSNVNIVEIIRILHKSRLPEAQFSGE